MAEIDFDGPDPIYRQLAAILRARIESGVYPPNRKIPSESRLRTEFDVSGNTVRSAIRVLAADGLVRGVKGRGVFVVGGTDAP